jgi:outer membrane protein assembly factor BamB
MLDIRIHALILAVTAIFASAAKAQSEDLAWPMQRHDMRNSGLSAADARVVPAVKWAAHADGVWTQSGPVVGRGGAIYLGASNKVYCFSSNGVPKWSNKTGPLTDMSGLAIGGDGTVYTSPGPGNQVFALDGDTGDVKWSAKLDALGDASPAVGPGGSIYIQTQRSVYALNPTDGTVRWQVSPSPMGSNYGSPAVTTDASGKPLIICAFRPSDIGKNGLVCVRDDGSSGAIVWSIATALHLNQAALSPDGLTAYVAGLRDFQPRIPGNFFAIDARTGTVKWSIDTRGHHMSGLCVGRDGTIYVGSATADTLQGKGQLFAIKDNGSSGSVKWVTAVSRGADATATPAVTPNGVIYIGTQDGAFSAVQDNGDSAALLWSFEIGSRCSTAAIGADGTAYFSNGNDRLVALAREGDPEAAPPTGPWMSELADRLARGPSVAVASLIRYYPNEYVRLKIAEDWIAQDGVDGEQGMSVEAILKPIDEIGVDGAQFRLRYDELQRAAAPVGDRRWVQLYLEACEARRTKRLAPHLKALKQVVFTKHLDMGGSHYAYTEALSDANSERNIEPGSSLCLLDMSGGAYGIISTLIDEPNGVIRDPDVSCDASRMLFSWKKSVLQDDYHLYEMKIADRTVRQLTSGLGFADYEGAYLPSGDIVFNSTRCVQIVDCWWTEVSNLFTCDADGKYMRRLSYDQVHTNFPTVTPDGRVIYTRWDYNDRGQLFPQGLFQMSPDGTNQTEVYGNNSWFPTTILHARAIPGTGKIVGIFTGHHTLQQGWLGIVDPCQGRQENSGAQLICPVRKTNSDHIDGYGQSDDLFQYPFPLSPRDFLATYRRSGEKRFVIAYVTEDGKREILAADPNISCNQPIPLLPKPVPHVRPSAVDYRKDTGDIYMQDIYAGPGLAGIKKGTVKSLRVIALDYRAAGVGENNNQGSAGGAVVSTPVSIQGSWDVKKVLGTAKVYDDGSACFTVPARTPIYFQALDGKGHAVQTMRSWATLQPGEKVSCVGCHDSKNSAPPSAHVTQAMSARAQTLTPWYGKPRGFSFAKEVQPALDKHCVSCHNRARDPKVPFSLEGTGTPDPGAGRKWSDAYKSLADRKYCSWIDIQAAPPMLKPYAAGAAQSKLISMLEAGHQGVRLSQDEMDKLSCWIDLLVPFCGDYTEGFDGQNLARYNQCLDKRKRWEAEEVRNIEELNRLRYGNVKKR